MAKTIPQIRARMMKLGREAIELGDELIALAEATRRRPPVKRAPTTSPSLTPELAAQIRRYALQHPDVPNREIGALFGVDGGRVTDAMRGLRDQ